MNEWILKIHKYRFSYDIGNRSLADKRLEESSFKKDVASLVENISEILKISGELESKADLLNSDIENISAVMQEITAKNEEVLATATMMVEEQTKK